MFQIETLVIEPSPLEVPTVADPMTDKAKESLKSIGFYSIHLRNKLDPSVFEPTPIRLLWFFGFMSIALTSLIAIRNIEMIWPLKALLGVLIGTCFGGLGFFSHELLHGSVIKNRTLQNFLAFFCFMPFFISPTFWRFWHNQLHHGKTQALIADPDAFPTLKIYKHSKFMQAMFPYTPGSGYKRGYTYFFFWFSFHVFVAQIYLRFRNAQFERLNHHKVTFEFAAQILLWGGFLYWLGPQNLIWTWVLPLFAQNYFAMSYIATNHNLSPLTKINDPLVNSLTVTNHPILEALHLNFGYHVEHHILPNVSGLHARKIHVLLKQDFPATFKCMKKWTAIRKLYSTARIYKTTTTLTNPHTGDTFPTL